MTIEVTLSPETTMAELEPVIRDHDCALVNIQGDVRLVCNESIALTALLIGLGWLDPSEEPYAGDPA